MSFRSFVKMFIPKNLFKKIEPWGHLGEAIVFNLIYGFPAKNMQVIGVTGTNGKTTTSYMIHKMLVEAGYFSGLMTTVAYGVNEDIKPQLFHMTTVPIPTLMKRLKSMKKAGAQWLVLEVTSQALVQNRVWGVPFSVAVMTNLTHEHLDIHGTFDNYRDAKRKLFKITNSNKNGLQAGIINADDDTAGAFASDIKNPITYGVNSGDWRALNQKLSARGSTFTAKKGDQSYDIVCNLPGSFNVYNALACVAVGDLLGLEREQIVQGIKALESVEGRMTRISEGQDFEVIVDYAHTPDSFEKLFRDIKPTVQGKLIAMFGSAGGPRDELKRPIQGEIAGKYADEVILTEEDDRYSDGQQILEQISLGAQKAGKTLQKDLFLVHDRHDAIKFTISRAKKGDMVLLLGKGHEKTIERADGEHPWDEIGTAQQALKN